MAQEALLFREQHLDQAALQQFLPSLNAVVKVIVLSLGMYTIGQLCSHLCELALEAYEVYLCGICSKIGGDMQVNAVHAAELGDPAGCAAAVVTLMIILDAKVARLGNAQCPSCSAACWLMQKKHPPSETQQRREG